METALTPAITAQPEFYDSQKASEQYLGVGGDRRPKRKTSGYTPEQYLLLWHERVKAEVERNMRKLSEMFVTVHRRFRGVTISDQWGYFGTRRETEGRWIDYDPDVDGEVHPINIVRPDIRTNNAAMLQIGIAAQVSATNQNAKNAEKAKKIQAMIDFFGRNEWREADRLLMFDGIQKEGTWLLENYKCEGKTQKVKTPEIKKSYFAVYQCQSCGAQGKKEISEHLGAAMAESGQAQQVPCPDCGGAAVGNVNVIPNLILVEKTLPSYKIKHRLWSGFNFAVDRKGAAKGGIRTMRYLRIHQRIERGDFNEKYPQFADVIEHPFEPCYPLRCEAALTNGDFSQIWSTHKLPQTTNEFDEFEEDTYCLHKEAYKGYVSPSDWEFRGADGKVKFSIKANESMHEAVHRHFGSGTEGFRFVVVNDRLVDIVNDKYTEPNFRKAFSDIHFLRDSASFHSIPHWDSVQLQDDITLFNTIKTETAARNSVRPVFFNSEVFDIEDFGQDYIPSKDGILAEDVDINKAVMQVPIAGTSDEVNEHLTFLLGIRSEVSSVTPALKGASQPGEPAYAQRQQLEQSMGILAPAAKSYAELYINSMKQKIEMAFGCFTFEQFQQIAGTVGEEWSEAEIAELCETDLETEVAIDYVPGSELPQGNLVKEMKFYNGLRETMPFIQGGLITPDIVKQILKKIDEFAQFDFDLSGLETSDALAQNRYEKLTAACKEFAQLSRFKVQQLKEQIVSKSQEMSPEGAIIETPITAFDTMIEQIFHNADIFITEFEDIEAQALWFIERMKEELTKVTPNFVLIETLQQFVGILKTQGQMQTEEAAANDPNLKAQKQAEETDRADAQTAESAKNEQAIAQKLLDETSKEKDREIERERMAHEADQMERDRQMQLQKGE